MKRRQDTTTAEKASEAEQSSIFTPEAETGNRRAKNNGKKSKQNVTKK